MTILCRLIFLAESVFVAQAQDCFLANKLCGIELEMKTYNASKREKKSEAAAMLLQLSTNTRLSR